MATSIPFEAAWRDLDRRSALLWVVFFGFIPGVLLLAYVLNERTLPGLVALAWMAAIAWAGLRMASFTCPRCGRAFFETWYFFKPLRHNCAHCDLPRSAKQAPPG